jgi:3-methylcrotonyl-CoA carboxylase alpha subunit
VGIDAGADVTPYYDSMLAKLIVHASNRSEAISRLDDALRRYTALGVITNLEFLHWIVSHPDFRAGRVDVNFVDRHWTPREEEPPIEALFAAVARDLMSPAESNSSASAYADAHNPWRVLGAWRQEGIAREIGYRYGDRAYEVEVVRLGNGEFQFRHENTVRRVGVAITEPDTIVLHDGPHRFSFKVAQSGDETAVQQDGRVFRFQRSTLKGAGLSSSGGGVLEAGLSAPMPGTVVKVEVQPGQRVSMYEPLIVLEAMKMEHVIVAPHDGVVRAIFFDEGDMVPAGSPLLALETA